MKKSCRVIVLVWSVLVQQSFGLSALPGLDEIKILGADSEFVYLRHLPNKPLEDMWDSYEILSRVIESWQDLAARTYSTVSVAQISMSKESIAKCTVFLTQIYPNIIAQVLSHNSGYTNFETYIKDRATDIDLLANQVGMFNDILLDVGVKGLPVQKSLGELKQGLLFVSHCLSELLLKWTPELSLMPGMASELEAKGPTRFTKEARNKWKLALVLHKMITDLRNGVFDQVNIIGEELMLAIYQTDLNSAAQTDVGALAQGLANITVSERKDKIRPILKYDGAAARELPPRQTCFGCIYRPRKKEVKFKVSKNISYAQVTKYRSKPKRKCKRARLAA